MNSMLKWYNIALRILVWYNKNKHWLSSSYAKPWSGICYIYIYIYIYIYRCDFGIFYKLPVSMYFLECFIRYLVTLFPDKLNMWKNIKNTVYWGINMISKDIAQLLLKKSVVLILYTKTVWFNYISSYIS